MGPSDTVSRVAGCEMSHHGLSVTNYAAMLQQGKQQYSTGWIYDNEILLQTEYTAFYEKLLQNPA